MPSASQNDTTGYTPVAKMLHWLVVALIVAQFAVAWTMPEIKRDTKPDTLINLHFSLGALILIVVAVRLAWRFTHPEPKPYAGLPPWQVTTSRLVHNTLYVLLLIIPILGWLNASVRGFDVSFFGLFTLPALVAPKSPGFRWTGEVHALLATYALLGVAALHISAALYHAAIRRDGVLARMLPGR
jgi:cytochrome b561